MGFHLFLLSLPPVIKGDNKIQVDKNIQEEESAS
jgi:hypothetical protein